MPNQGTSFTSLSEVEKLLKEAEGKSFRELDETNRGKSLGNKGSLGQIIEESVLHYGINSDPEADISVGNTRYEIKVTPVHFVGRKNRRRLVSKERLVMDIINYLKLPREVFDTSTFWKKAKNLIVIYYADTRTDKRKESRADCKVIKSFIFQYLKDDLSTIKQDWNKIHQEVSEGHADLLSEADTNYLAACTKGQTAASSIREAPGPQGQGRIRAKQRAFSFKQSYMTSKVHQLLGDLPEVSRLDQPKEQPLEEFIKNTIGRVAGSTVADLASRYNLDIHSTAKDFNSKLAFRILGTDRNSVSQVEQFTAANVSTIKSVVTYSRGFPMEHMSFPVIKESEWNDIAGTSPWEESSFYNFFANNRFLIVVFHSDGINRRAVGKEYDTLQGGFLWNMPKQDIDNYVKPVWLQLRTLLNSPEGLGYHSHNLLPGTEFNQVFHIRPHARNGQDCVTLPNGERITKQAFWLDRRYLGRVIQKNLGPKNA
ncbi:Sau3AI family type II restriction endonuclease [Bifidobacterium sp.]|uniref:Sau3AI family type II restriction endonuclease n=1 Tax=Bifidobacterium sp. TaxID=41200 RepID=UPI0039EB7F4F